MDTSAAFVGIACADCGAPPSAPATVTACPECGGRLAARYEFDERIDPAALPGADDQYRFGPLLPFDGDAAVTMGEGGTPLVECPSLASEVGVDRLLCKDEGANPTGSATDRGASLAVSAAADASVDTVALPSTGHGGRSVAAYAGRAGLDAEVFVPSRTPFDCKAMINVHGGEMTVVGGRYPDAAEAFESERSDDWADLGPGSVYRREGAVSLYGEILADLHWAVPDAVIVPAAHGTLLTGLCDAIDRFEEVGLTSGIPTLVVAQPEGCSPVVDAIEEERSVEPIEHPDTIAGALEIPAPALGDAAASAVCELGGTGTTVTDDDAFAAAVEANAVAGREVGVAGGVALAAAIDGADGALANASTVVVCNPTAGGTESDVLRSHLMGQGI